MENQVQDNPPERRKAPRYDYGRGELRAFSYGGIILGLITTGAALLAASVMETPPETLDFLWEYWWVPPLLGLILMPYLMMSVVNKARFSHVESRVDLFKVAGVNLGFEYFAPDESEVPYSGGSLAGEYKGRSALVISDSEEDARIRVCYFAVELTILNATRITLEVRMSGETLAAIVVDEGKAELEYLREVGPEELAGRLFANPELRAEFEELELYQLDIYANTLRLKFIDRGDPDPAIIEVMLELASRVADSIQS